MTSVFSPPSTISFVGQGGDWTSNSWEQKTSNAGHNGTTVFCYGIVGSTDTDAIFTFDATTGVVTFAVNSAQTVGTPGAWSQHTTVFPGYPGAQPGSLSSDGDTLTADNIVHMWDAHSGAVFLKGYFTFSSSWITSSTGTDGEGFCGSGPNTGSIEYDVPTETITVTIDAASESDSCITYKVTWLAGLTVNSYGPYAHTLGTTNSTTITSNESLLGTWRLITVDENWTTTILDELVIGGGAPPVDEVIPKKKVFRNFW